MQSTGGGLAHRIRDAETPCDRDELTHLRYACRRVGLAEQRVDGDEQLRLIVDRETPIGVRKAGGNRLERESQAFYLELRPPHRTWPTDIELETEDVA